MKICWVTSDVWYSYLLRWLFDAQTSHVGTIFNDEIVVDINRPVGKKYTARSWLTHYKIVWQVELKLPPEQETELLDIVTKYAVGKPYDVNGYYFGMLCGLLNKLFRIPFPKNNWFSEKGKDMCQEVVRPILEYPPIAAQQLGIDPEILNKKTPDGVIDLFKEATKNKPEWIWSHIT